MGWQDRMGCEVGGDRAGCSSRVGAGAGREGTWLGSARSTSSSRRSSVSMEDRCWCCTISMCLRREDGVSAVAAEAGWRPWRPWPRPWPSVDTSVALLLSESACNTYNGTGRSASQLGAESLSTGFRGLRPRPGRHRHDGLAHCVAVTAPTSQLSQSCQ